MRDLHELADTVRRITGGHSCAVVQDRPGREVVRVVDRRGRRCVVKFDVRPERSAREQAVLDHLAAGPARHLVPRVLDHGRLPEGPAFLRMTDAGTRPGPDSPARWRAAGTALRTLHQALTTLPTAIAPDLQRPYVLRDFAACQVAALVADGTLSAPRARGLLTRLDATAPKTAVVHGDLKHEHVLCGPAGVCVIDWADVRLASPLWDVAVLTLDRPAATAHVLGGYGADSSSDRASVALHRLVRAMSDIVWARRAGTSAAGPLARLHALLATDETADEQETR